MGHPAPKPEPTSGGEATGQPEATTPPAFVTLPRAANLTEVPEGCNVLEFMTRDGAELPYYNPGNPEEVASAKNLFEEAKKAGRIAYKVTESGEQGEALTEFDPAAKRTIIAKMLAGG